MNPDMERMQKQITDLADEYIRLTRKTEESFDSLVHRIDSLWWKIGVISGAVSILLAKVFGASASGLIDMVLGVL